MGTAEEHETRGVFLIRSRYMPVFCACEGCAAAEREGFGELARAAWHRQREGGPPGAESADLTLDVAPFAALREGPEHAALQEAIRLSQGPAEPDGLPVGGGVENAFTGTEADR